MATGFYQTTILVMVSTEQDMLLHLQQQLQLTNTTTTCCLCGAQILTSVQRTLTFASKIAPTLSVPSRVRVETASLSPKMVVDAWVCEITPFSCIVFVHMRLHSNSELHYVYANSLIVDVHANTVHANSLIADSLIFFKESLCVHQHD